MNKEDILQEKSHSDFEFIKCIPEEFKQVKLIDVYAEIPHRMNYLECFVSKMKISYPEVFEKIKKDLIGLSYEGKVIKDVKFEIVDLCLNLGFQSALSVMGTDGNKKEICSLWRYLNDKEQNVFDIIVLFLELSYNFIKIQILKIGKD